MELLEYKLPYLTIKVKCSKGTYVRALARDVGLQLGSGAHLTELRRTYIGDYKVEDAITKEEFEKTLVSLKQN